MYDPLDPRDLVADELTQRRTSGWDVDTVQEAVSAALARPEVDPAQLRELLEQMEVLPRRADWPYDEPDDISTLRQMRELRGLAGPSAARLPASDLPFEDRLLGAWLGRCAGCTLGKPVEGWSRGEIHRLLGSMDLQQIDDYILAPEPWPDDLPAPKASWPEATRGRIVGAPRDDDIDFTLLGLLLVEQHGIDFDAAAVGRLWLSRVPILQLFTAERAAYRNLVKGLTPPTTASLENPYREWIGAVIRADIHAYVRPGRPREAALAALADATLSHTGNGIYAAMWAAALISLALIGMPPAMAVPAAARHVPATSRLAAAIAEICRLHARETPWPEAMRAIDEAWGHLPWVHAVPNVATIAAALLWGEGDFTRTVGLVVEGGRDTDSNGATAGSACGALVGADALPDRWVEPLDDRVRSAVAGLAEVRISDLAARTAAVALPPPSGSRAVN